MRTTVRLDDQLLAEAKQMAARTGRTLTSIIEDGLRLLLAQRRERKGSKEFRLPTFKGDGLQPGVDLDDSAALYDLMDGLD